MRFATYKYLILYCRRRTFADIDWMNFGDVFVIYLGSYLTCCLFILWKARVIWSEDANMFDDYFVRFSSKPVYFEPPQSQYFVLYFSIINWYQIGEKLLLSRKGAISGDPIFCVSHLNTWINWSIIILN